MYYEDDNTEHHRVNCPPYNRNFHFLGGKTGNKTSKNISSPYNYYLQ